MLFLLIASCDENRFHAEAAGRDRCGKACVSDGHLLDEGSYIHAGETRAAELFRNFQSLVALLDRFLIDLLRPFAGNIIFFALFYDFFITEIFNVLQEVLRFFRN